MHHCPECGQACHCHGDIDDCVVETERYSALHCVCNHEGSGMDEADDEFDHYPDDVGGES